MFAEDADAFLKDFGSPVIFGNLTTWATFDQADADVLTGRVQSTQYRIEYPRSKLVGLGNNDTVLIGIGPGWQFDATGTRLEYVGAESEPDSGYFRIMGTPKKLDDGVFMEAQLQRV